MRKNEVTDPVVRAVVLIREAQNILSDYQHSISDHSDRQALAGAQDNLYAVRSELESDFGLYLGSG